MKNALFTVMIAALWAAPSRAAEDTYDTLFQETIQTIEKLNFVLSTVKDKSTAESAKLDFEKTAKTMAELKKRTEKRGEPSADEKQELEKKYKPKMDVAIKSLQKEMDRIFKLEGGMDIVQDFAKSLAPLAEKPINKKPLDK